MEFTVALAECKDNSAIAVVPLGDYLCAVNLYGGIGVGSNIQTALVMLDQVPDFSRVHSAKDKQHYFDRFMQLAVLPGAILIILEDEEENFYLCVKKDEEEIRGAGSSREAAWRDFWHYYNQKRAAWQQIR